MELEKEVNTDKTEIDDQKDWWEMFETNENDRTIAIIAICVIDNLLKKLLKKAMLQKCELLFNDQNILQTTSSKIQMCYFLGLIPEQIYKDLIIINRIRNKFAHIANGKMSFSDEPIFNLLISVNLKPRDLENERNEELARIRYSILAQQLMDCLTLCIELCEKIKLTKLTDLCQFEKKDWNWSMSKEQINEINKKKRIQCYSVKKGTSGIDNIRKDDSICIDTECNIKEIKESDLIVFKMDNEIKFGNPKIINDICYVNKEKYVELTDDIMIGKIVRLIREYV